MLVPYDSIDNLTPISNTVKYTQSEGIFFDPNQEDNSPDITESSHDQDVVANNVENRNIVFEGKERPEFDIESRLNKSALFLKSIKSQTSLKPTRLPPNLNFQIDEDEIEQIQNLDL